jgi:hypothetical protein
MVDAKIPMPAASASMLMPSYVDILSSRSCKKMPRQLMFSFRASDMKLTM